MFGNFKRGLGSKTLPGPWWCSGYGSIPGELFLERICWLVCYRDICFNAWWELFLMAFSSSPRAIPEQPLFKQVSCCQIVLYVIHFCL
jgi:hypothetical protein